MDSIHKLEQLTELYRKGILTKDEFEREKAKITNVIGENKYNSVEGSTAQNGTTRAHSTNNDLTKHGFNYPKVLSKRKKIIIFTSTLLLVVGIIFIALYKNPYERALEKIDDCGGHIFADIKDHNNNHNIIYSTTKGLFLWDIKEKSPKELFSNLDSLTVRSYYIDQNNYGVTYSEIPYLKLIENMELSTDMVSALKELPDDLFNISWPWIFIGKQFVAHVTEPNTLININDYKTSNNIIYNPYVALEVSDDEQEGPYSVEDSVDITSNGDLVLTLAGWAPTLPGYNDYKPTLIDHPTLKNHLYFDNGLYNEFGRLSPNMYLKLAILLPINNFFYRTVVIDKFNFCHIKKEIKLDDMIIFDEELSKEGLQKVYLNIDVKCRDFLLKEIPKKRKELYSYIEDNAISVYKIKDAYQGNRDKASQLYPFYQQDIFLARISSIRRTPLNGLYELSGGYGLSIYTTDETFLQLIYPKRVWFSAVIRDFYWDGNHYILEFSNAQALLWEND